MPDLDWANVVDFTESLTHSVGAELLAQFGHVQAQAKADGSLVTQADQWADQTLRAAIQRQYPEHGLLSEETSQIFPATPWCWVIDPLDGTTNFAQGIPLWGISLGLLYQGIPVFGAVYIPPLGDFFHGFWSSAQHLDTLALPSGAFHNHQPITVTTAALSSNHLFSFCTRSIHHLDLPNSGSSPFPCKIRMLGVATYNVLSIATGAVIGGVEATPKVWDIAATWVITQAAGATWKFLQMEAFPLQPMQDYIQASYPSLVTAQPDLQSAFQPFLTSLCKFD
ncbi:MAG: inositol monophosphatase family protein [Cyanobacteria bacterium P01_H01_bin.121]